MTKCGRLPKFPMSEQTIILPPNPSGNGNDANYRLTVFAPKRRFLSYLRDRWWVVLLCVLVTTGAAVVFDTVRPETYTSFAQLYLSGDVQMGVAGQFTEDARNYFGTQIEVLKSSKIQQAAYQDAGGPPNGSLQKLAALEVVQPMGTSILRLRITGTDPRFTQAFLKALIDEYLSYKKEIRQSTSGDAVESLTTLLGKQKDVLQAEQDKFADFVKSNKFDIAVLQEEGRTKGLYLNDLTLQLARLKLDRELLQKGITSFESASSAFSSSSNLAAGSLATAGVGAGAGGTNLAGSSNTNLFSYPDNYNSLDPAGKDAVLRDARMRLEDLKIEYAEVLKQPGGGMAAAKAQHLPERISEAEQMLKQREDDNLAAQHSDLEAKDKLIAAIENRIPDLKATLNDIYERLSQAQRLNNSIQREQASLDDLRNTLRRVDLGRNVEQERLSVLESASPPQPTRHLLALWVALAVVAGLALSTLIVFVWHILDDRFSSIGDLKDQFGEMLLGLIPQVRARGARPREALLRDGDARHAYVESFRHLRSALLLAAPARARTQTLLVTSAGPGEGKTTIAANLAGTLARSGLRVALIDADPHGGELHHLFDLPEKPGLFDFLRGEATAEAVMHATSVPGLLLVPRGVFNHDADGLFLRPKLGELMAALRQDRDFIILDGAPVLAADDAALLAPHADSVLVVVRPYYTRARLLRRALDMLYHRQVKQVGLILNRARADDLAGKYAMNGRASSRRNGAAKTNGKAANGKIHSPPRTPIAH